MGYSPLYGPSWWYSSPSLIGWSRSLMFGYQSYAIPDFTTVVSPYYSGYVPAGYILQ